MSSMKIAVKVKIDLNVILTTIMIKISVLIQQCLSVLKTFKKLIEFLEEKI